MCEIQRFNEITIAPLQDRVTWYEINYAGTQITQWDFQNNATSTSPARLSFVLKVLIIIIIIIIIINY